MGFYKDQATRVQDYATMAKQTPMISIVEMLHSASAAMKFPQIRLRTHDGNPIKLNIAGPSSRYPGTISVSNGANYGSANNEFYGRISKDGEWQPVPYWQKPGLRGKLETITMALLTFAEDPQLAAKVYGQETSNCCFCGKELNNKSSVAHGYGPVCAERYGLPWGD